MRLLFQSFNERFYGTTRNHLLNIVMNFETTLNRIRILLSCTIWHIFLQINKNKNRISTEFYDASFRYVNQPNEREDRLKCQFLATRH